MPGIIEYTWVFKHFHFSLVHQVDFTRSLYTVVVVSPVSIIVIVLHGNVLNYFFVVNDVKLRHLNSVVLSEYFAWVCAKKEPPLSMYLQCVWLIGRPWRYRLKLQNCWEPKTLLYHSRRTGLVVTSSEIIDFFYPPIHFYGCWVIAQYHTSASYTSIHASCFKSWRPWKSGFYFIFYFILFFLSTYLVFGVWVY